MAATYAMTYSEMTRQAR